MNNFSFPHSLFVISLFTLFYCCKPTSKSKIDPGSTVVTSTENTTNNISNNDEDKSTEATTASDTASCGKLYSFVGDEFCKETGNIGNNINRKVDIRLVNESCYEIIIVDIDNPLFRSSQNEDEIRIEKEGALRANEAFKVYKNPVTSSSECVLLDNQPTSINPANIDTYSLNEVKIRIVNSSVTIQDSSSVKYYDLNQSHLFIWSSNSLTYVYQPIIQ